MSRVLSLLITHPKKSVFACVLTGYSYHYLSTVYGNERLRRDFCASVKSLGTSTISPNSQIRRLTVFLNPFARRGRLLKEFETNVAPILQLSGIDVQMVYTDSDVEVKDFVSVLDSASTDGILVASDDHVLQKAVSALLQRTDFNSSGLRNLPVGIVPIGIWNTFAETISRRGNIVEWCYNVLAPVLNSTTRRHHVLEITTISPKTIQFDSSSLNLRTLEDPLSSLNDENCKSARKTYSLLGLEWSVWRDVEHGGGHASSKRKSKPVDTNNQLGLLDPLSLYSPRTWSRHIGVLGRHVWFWLRSDIDHQPSLPTSPFFEVNQTAYPSSPSPVRRIRSKHAFLVYTLPCDGCSKCWQSRAASEQVDDLSTESKKPRSLFSRLLGLSQSVPNGSPNPSSDVPVVEDRSCITNDECGRHHTMDLNHVAGITLALDGDRVRVDVHGASTHLLEYVHSVFSRLRKSGYEKTLPLNDRSYSFYCASLWLFPFSCENEYYWIDNDHFEACPVKVHVRRNAMNMYI